MSPQRLAPLVLMRVPVVQGGAELSDTREGPRSSGMAAE